MSGSSIDIFHTREYFQHRLELEKIRAKRFGEKISIVFLNLNRVEPIHLYKNNSREFFYNIASITFSLVRIIDVAAWYTPNSIAILLCDTSLDGAREFVKRLHLKLSKHIDKDLLNNIKIDISTYPDYCEN